MPEYADQPPRSLIPFNESIRLDEVSYRYKSSSTYVFKDINLTIKKGTCIGFIGQTGCGKTTMLDVIMGLLSIKEGKLRVDGETITKKNVREWQGHISHVPQTLYLADLTIMENIAFGIEKANIDEERVIRAAKKAKIHDTISKLDSKYETMAGERGVRLSGGQRQRIGIARALYKETSVLIFDEATSALDNKTESAVIDSLNKLDSNLTIIIVAHRLSTIEKCDRVIKVDKNNISEIKK